MSRKIEDLDPKMRPLAAEFQKRAWAAGLPVVFTQTRRSLEEQDALYAQGRTVPGKIVTNAPGGSSPHCPGLAFDVAFQAPEKQVTWDEPRPGAWDELGAIGTTIGLVWGGGWKHFVDRPHFEFEDWRVAARGQSLRATEPQKA
jgi:peptidoglycan L-alanyl-D-glutamate endopeptidase CwlK